jgi:hypothetical protein
MVPPRLALLGVLARAAVSAHGPSIPCETLTCSSEDVCCGTGGDGLHYCASHCDNCYNNSGSISCPCNSGYSGSRCTEQSEPTTWLAVILAVGTMLILFIAWGFRCQRNDDTEYDPAERTTAPPMRTPLMRENTDNIVAAAQPPTPRGTTGGESTVISEGGAPTEPRTCCVCMVKPIQVVVIPCGHACMCRKCSFQVSKCPVCRLDIQAQQRFFW